MQFAWSYISNSESLYFKPNKAPVQLCNPENMLGLKQDERTINKRGKKNITSLCSFEVGTGSNPHTKQIAFLSHQLKGIKTVLS